MPERLVDIAKQDATVLHTFPVTITDADAKPEEEAFKRKALEAAGHAKLVPKEELASLQAQVHVGRRGLLTPYGDRHGVLAETKEGLDQVVRERAYVMWEQAGRPDGMADEFWHQVQYSAFASGLTRCGNGKAIRKARQMSTGFGFAALRRTEEVPPCSAAAEVTWIR